MSRRGGKPPLAMTLVWLSMAPRRIRETGRDWTSPPELIPVACVIQAKEPGKLLESREHLDTSGSKNRVVGCLLSSLSTWKFKKKKKTEVSKLLIMFTEEKGDFKEPERGLWGWTGESRVWEWVRKVGFSPLNIPSELTFCISPALIYVELFPFLLLLLLSSSPLPILCEKQCQLSISFRQ